MAAYAPAAVALPGDSPDVGEPGTGVGVSVVVPLYGRDPVSPTWLEAMERALRDQDAELLVVDNGPFPGVERLELSAPTRLVRCATPGAYAARNVGARHARGHWLVFTDADCLPQPGWLQALVGNASSADGLRAGAVQVRANGAPPNPWERYDVVRGIPQEHYVARGYAVTANLAMPAALLSALGGFDEQRFSGGDAELCRQAVAAGYPLVYVPEAVVEHPARDSWRALATKARRLKGGQLKVGPSGDVRCGGCGRFCPRFWNGDDISHGAIAPTGIGWWPVWCRVASGPWRWPRRCACSWAACRNEDDLPDGRHGDATTSDGPPPATRPREMVSCDSAVPMGR